MVNICQFNAMTKTHNVVFLYFLVVYNFNRVILCVGEQKVNQPMIQAETNQQLLQFHLQLQVIQKVIRPPLNLKRNLKLLLDCENSHLMILSWRQEILDLRVFLVKVVLAACSRGGLKKMELLR